MGHPSDLHDDVVVVTSKGLMPRARWGLSTAALVVVSNKWFDRIVITLILANCVFLALVDPLDNDPESLRNRVITVSDLVFLVAFSIELVIKVLALGLCGKGSYLWDAWNVIDAFLVFGGWLAFMPGLAGSNLSSIRVVRVLRPLRTINNIEGLRILIDSLLSALPQLLNVLGLCAFIFFLFGLVGLQLFPGKLNQRCHLPGGFNGSASAELVPYDPLWSSLCNTASTSAFACPEVVVPVWNGTAVEQTSVQLVCAVSSQSQNLDITNFDNIGTAFLTIFQCITLEGWVDVMYWIEETSSAWTNLYFIFLITFGSLFLLNLIIAAMTINLSVERSLKAKQVQVNEWDALATGGHVQTTTEATTADVMTAVVAAKYQTDLKELEEEKALASTPSMFRSHTGLAAAQSLRETRLAEGEVGLAAAQTPSSHGDASLLSTLLERRKHPGTASDEASEAVVSVDENTVLDMHTSIGNSLPTLDETQSTLANSTESKEAEGQVRAHSPRHEQSPIRGTGGYGISDIPRNVARPVHRQTRLEAQAQEYAELTALNREVLPSDETPEPHALDRWEPPQTSKLRHACFTLVKKRAFGVTVMALIILNTVLLAVEHHRMPSWLVSVTEAGNIVLTALFSLEMVIKLCGLGMAGYVADGFNVFDAAIVIGSWVEFVLAVATGGGSSAVSALRTFRLLRIFKLAKSWKSFNMLLSTTLKSLPRIGPFSVVLLIFMFIFSLLGMQVLGGMLGTGDNRHRAHYDSLLWAFTTTFQVCAGSSPIVCVCVCSPWLALVRFSPAKTGMKSCTPVWRPRVGLRHCSS